MNADRSPPKTSDIYTDLGPSDIRLVDILPSLNFSAPLRIRIRTVSLDNAPRYTALSYVWNPQDGSIDSLCLPEKVAVDSQKHLQLTVGANLAAAMRQLRLDEGIHTLWIDAMSINQSSDRERNHQVALMRKIYSYANEVYIWLGPEKDHSNLVMHAVSTGRLDEGVIHQFMSALELLLRRDWFGRVWVAQELALASREPIVLCGSNNAYWSRFVAAVQVIRARILDESDPPDIDMFLGQLDSDLIFNRDKTSGLQKRVNHLKWFDQQVPLSVVSKALRVSNLADIRATGNRASLADQIQRTLYMQASDPRDRIFALTGLTSPSNSGIAVDYTKPKEQIAAEVAALLIREDFAGYMTTRLWEHTRYTTGLTPGNHTPGGTSPTSDVPSFSPELDALGRRTLSARFAPPVAAIRQIMKESSGVVPIAEFTNDCREMMTLGFFMGTVTSMDAWDGRFTTSMDYHGYAPFNDEPEFAIFLVGLFGINAPFLLRQTQVKPRKYKILALVSLDDEGTVPDHPKHTWGHQFLKNVEAGEKHPTYYSRMTPDDRRWHHMKWYDHMRMCGEADGFKLYIIH
jgi:hypothetical protein